MKSVLIIYNQANTERVEFMLDKLGIRGFTHTWPEMNSAIITVIEDSQVESLLSAVKKLDMRNPAIGVRAFVWNIEQTV